MYNETCEKCNRSGFEYLINGMCSKCAKEELDSLQSQLDAARGEVERLKRSLGDDGPYPILSCITILTNAAEHLLNVHNCDQHGYEKVGYAIKAARKHKERIEQALKEGDS